MVLRTSLSSCRVAMFVNQPIQYDPETNEYTTDYPNLVDFLLRAAEQFETLVLCTPVSEGRGRNLLDVPENASFVHLPHYHGPLDLVKSMPQVVPSLLKAVKSEPVRSADIVGSVAPSTLGVVTIPFTYYLRRKPHFLFMRGDKRQTVSHISADDGLKGQGMRWCIRAYDRFFGHLSHAEDVVLFTVGELSETISSYGYDGSATEVLYPLIDSDLIVDHVPVQSSARDLLYVGRLSAEKGLDNLLRAVANIIEEGDSARLHLVGSGPAEASLLKLASKLGIKEAVSFHGFIAKDDGLWRHFDEADAFVLPSHTEGLPRVVAEAMARGLPVISTRVGGIPELLSDGEDAILVPPHDIEELEVGIRGVLSDESLRKRLATNGLRTVERLTFERGSADLAKSIDQKLLATNRI